MQLIALFGKITLLISFWNMFASLEVKPVLSNCSRQLPLDCLLHDKSTIIPLPAPASALLVPLEDLGKVQLLTVRAFSGIPPLGSLGHSGNLGRTKNKKRETKSSKTARSKGDALPGGTANSDFIAI